jgi:hypothetical protein
MSVSLPHCGQQLRALANSRGVVANNGSAIRVVDMVESLNLQAMHTRIIFVCLEKSCDCHGIDVELS